MKTDKIGIIVTARVNSRRLYQKALQLIKNRTTFEILLDKLNNNKYQIIVALPQNPEDDVLETIAKGKGIEVYRGEDDSPIHRLYECARLYDLDHIVRITHDDILIDLSLLFRQIIFHVNGDLDYTFMAKCPSGVAGEVIKVSALERAVDNVLDKKVEFVSYYLKTSDFYYKEFYPPFEYQYTYRLTLDYEEDLTQLRLLFSSLAEPFGTLDIINFYKNHKYFLNINKMPEVTIYSCNYNTNDYIIDCMDSVFAQKFDDYEYIVIDDHSSDNSINTIIEYYSNLSLGEQNRMKILRNTENIGLPACCNEVLNKAKGKYIMRLDSDDVLEPHALQEMIETIKIENVQGVFSGYYETRDALSITASVIEDRHHPAGCLLSRWCVNELKYKEDLEYLEGEEFFNRFDEKYKSYFIDKPLWKYRKREGQKTQDENHPHRGGNG